MRLRELREPETSREGKQNVQLFISKLEVCQQKNCIEPSVFASQNTAQVLSPIISGPNALFSVIGYDASSLSKPKGVDGFIYVLETVLLDFYRFFFPQSAIFASLKPQQNACTCSGVWEPNGDSSVGTILT